MKRKLGVGTKDGYRVLGPVTGLAPCLPTLALSSKDRARCPCVGQCSDSAVASVGMSRRRSRDSDRVCVC